MIISPKITVPNIMLVAFVAFMLSAFALDYVYISKFKIPPEATLGFSLPKGFPIVSSLKVDEGKTVSFFNPEKQHRVSIARSATPTSLAAITGAEIIKAVLAFQKEHVLDPRLSPLSLKFVSAEIDARRVFDINSEMKDGIEITRFQANDSANYGMAVVRTSNEEFMVLAFHKGSPVDLDYVVQVIREVQGHAAVPG